MKTSFYSTQLLWQKLSFGLVMLGLFLWLAASSSAAPGDLDTSFGNGGKVITPIPGGISQPTRVRIQPDGKIVAVGFDSQNGFANTISFLVRHNTDGTIDNSFGINGSVVVVASSEETTFQDFVILPDGKFLVTGYKFGLTSVVVVLYRYTANGTLDATFGTNGVVTTPVDGLFGRRIVLQPDGKFVVGCGTYYAGSYGVAVVVRYNPNGTLDATFGTSGITTLSGFQNIGEILVQTDGKLLVAGDTGSGSNRNIFVLRHNPNGTLDSGFGANGIVQTDVDNQSNAVGGMALQPDGKIIVNGENRNSANIVASSSIVRYNANGTLDNAFGANGIVRITESQSSSIAKALAIQQNGKILTAGERNGTFALSRYNSDGTIDASFGTNGVVITPIGNYPEYDAIVSIALQTDGKIVAVGSVKSFATGLGTDVGLARYLGDSLNALRTRFDFDGDGKADISIFRPAVGEWWLNRSLSGQTVAAQFGAGADKITPADFTGDGKTDIAVWRPSTGEWFVLRSEDGSFYSLPFGTAGDIPAPSDYDGDGRSDPAVFRPATATWFISLTSGGTSIVQFGASGDNPVVADYDGDGQSDIAIFRPSVGEWWYRRSSDGQVGALQFGASTDKPVPGDYTGDGRADIAFFRPDTGFWFILRSENNSYFSFPFGANGDILTPGDYDGDGKFDAAVYRPATATWYINRTTAGILITNFGATGDVPVPAAFVP
jgi:uncharacterized delta-60 repeat protein